MHFGQGKVNRFYGLSCFTCIFFFHVTRERVQPAPTALGISKYCIWKESSPVNKGEQQNIRSSLIWQKIYHSRV